MNFLFWNVRRKNATAEVCSIAREHTADVVLLAECEEPKKVELALTRDVKTYYLITTDRSPVHVFTAFTDRLSHVLEDGAHHTAISMNPPLLPSLLLVGVHLRSKLYQRSESQLLGATELANRIRDAETRVGHTRTIVIGDLNMDPFEAGVVGAGALHAVSTVSVATRESRTVDGRSYDFFYNPTWAHMSDRVDGPPGTYYRTDSEHVGYFWHSLDQVLLRPSLLPMFSRDGLQVLDKAGTVALTTDGRPSVSDHLPLLLTLRSREG